MPEGLTPGADGAAAAGYLDTQFGIGAVRITPASDGSHLVQTEPALEPVPTRLSDLLLHWARVAPERSYMAKRQPQGAWQHLRYGELLESVRAIGQALLDRGLDAQRPVLILSDNDLEHALLALAASHVGIPYAPVSPAYSLLSQDHGKLAHVMKLLTPGLVFASDGEAYAKAIAATVPDDVELVVTQRPPAGRRHTLFADLLASRAGAGVDAAREATGPDTIVKFLFTSGSTSMPKAVINTQRMICSNLTMVNQALPDLKARPPLLVDWLPWHHTFGGNHNTGITLLNGGTLYIDEGKPVQPLFAQTLRNLHELAPTIYFNVPKGFEELARALAGDEALRKRFFGSVRMLFYAGAGLAQPVWDSLYESAQRTLGKRVPFCTGLGMTETAPSALFTNRVDVASGMIGLPVAGVTAKLTRVGDKTEIRYRGPSVTPGYWRMPQATEQAFDEQGYFRSGDAVRWLDAARPELGFVFDGRIAEDFKLATGTWVSVGPLRAKVVAAGDPYAQDVVLTGINRNELGALVIPHLPSCRALAQLEASVPVIEVLRHPRVQECFGALFRRLAAEARGSSTRIARVLLLCVPPAIDRGEITDKGSINQRALLDARAHLVQALYDGDAAALGDAAVLLSY